jgi:hypothetical protein
VAIAQSASALQPMHSPVVVSQVRALPLQLVAVHAGWQSCVAGKHAGAAVGQSALVAQATHAPCTHRGAAVGQFESALHSTQPRLWSQICPVGQPFARHTPPTPVPVGLFGSTPPDVDDELLPPHEAASGMVTIETENAKTRPDQRRMRTSKQEKGACRDGATADVLFSI